MYPTSPLILPVLLLSLVCMGCSKTATPVSERTSAGTVKIEIELDDQLYSLTMEDVTDGTSLEEVLRNVDKPKFVIRGKNTSAFVDAIADQATGVSAGWTFRIDGAFSNRGIGMTMLHPPTTVTWTYGELAHRQLEDASDE